MRGSLKQEAGRGGRKNGDERRTVRQAQSKRLLDSLRQWFETTVSKLSRESDTTVAIRFAFSRWDALAS